MFIYLSQEQVSYRKGEHAKRKGDPIKANSVHQIRPRFIFKKSLRSLV